MSKGVGRRGEALVGQHLVGLGWRVLETNYRCAQGEIDLIAEAPVGDGSVLVFVEVKTRHGRGHGSASEAVDTRKREKLIATAYAYLGSSSKARTDGEEPAIRFDVAEVYIDSNDYATIHLHSAFFIEE